jgi:hypothetical protein
VSSAFRVFKRYAPLGLSLMGVRTGAVPRPKSASPARTSDGIRDDGGRPLLPLGMTREQFPEHGLPYLFVELRDELMRQGQPKLRLPLSLRMVATVWVPKFWNSSM